MTKLWLNLRKCQGFLKCFSSVCCNLYLIHLPVLIPLILFNECCYFQTLQISKYERMRLFVCMCSNSFTQLMCWNFFSIWNNKLFSCLLIPIHRWLVNFTESTVKKLPYQEMQFSIKTLVSEQKKLIIN